MLGCYENFPTDIHETTLFETLISAKSLQQALIKTLQKVNRDSFSFEQVANPTLPECTVIFEFGIADTNNFNYLDAEETQKTLKAIRKKPFQSIDLFCVLRYYKVKGEKKTSLRFDYYMIRFLFNKNAMETQVFHERGPRYISPEDITNFTVNKTNEAFSKKALAPIET